METIKVVVVEDVDDVREIITAMIRVVLKKLGFEPEMMALASSQDAFEMIEKAEVPFDMLLSDIQCNPEDLDELIGFDIVQRAKELMPNCVAILMTGLSAPDQIERGKAFGAVDCLQKPTNLTVLKEVLEKHLKR